MFSIYKLLPSPGRLARFRRFAGVNISKCLKIRAWDEKVRITAELVGQFASSNNSWFGLGGKAQDLVLGVTCGDVPV